MLRMLAGLLFIAATSAWGQADAPVVTTEQLNAAVEQVSASAAPDDPQRISLLKQYSEARAALLAYDQYQQDLETYRQARASATAEASAIQDELAKSLAAPQKEITVSRKLSLQELEQQIQIDRANLDGLRDGLAYIREAIARIPARQSEMRERLTELPAQITELGTQLGALEKVPEAGSEAEASLWLLQAQVASATAEKAALDEEMLSQPMRLQRLKAQQDQASYDIGRVEKNLQAMGQRADELRQAEAAKASAESVAALADTLGKHPLVQQLADDNAGLSASFGERSEAIEQARQREAAVSRRADQVATDLQSIERKLEILGMSAAVGEVLREHQSQLPSPRESSREIRATAALVAESSLRQVELEDERRRLSNAHRYVEQLLAGQTQQLRSEMEDDLLQLARTRRDLVGQAVDLENSYSQILGELDFNLNRYALAVDQYRDFISQRLLWMPSREMFSLFSGPALGSQLAEVFAPSSWLEVVRQLPLELLQQPLTALAIVLALVLFYFSPRLGARIVATGKEVGYVRTDLFANTVQALGLTLLLSFRWPLLLLTLAWLFEMQEGETGLASALYITFLRIALYVWGLEFQRLLLVPRGVVDAHFRWPTKRTSRLYRRALRLEQTFLPAAFFVILALNLYPGDVGGPLAALAVVGVLLSIADFFRRMPYFVQSKMDMMLNDNPSGESSFLGRLTRMLLVWLPLAAIVGVLFGYTYTAIELVLLLVETVILGAAILLFHELGLRWLRVARRRMTIKVREDVAQASGEETEASLEEELLENDPELLNYEGTRLLNVLTIFGGLIGVAVIWTEVFPALNILDSVELWHQTGLVDGREVPVPVTLKNLVVALAIAVLGWVALRRIPGLLEIFLRQKMKVRPASAYAATRVFQYAVTTALVVLVLGWLGGSWSQIQWAVAALSVGIGFGLQEIVANFICGLIILFEQPIRLGDTVTVGEVSGKVTKIRMRATTIRDFDQRELLVPNKEFITNQLLNWSLSDPVTRRLLEVGVAYGTDMDRALAIVREVAQQHPLVLAEPESMVTFDEFGDNSLLITLRYFLDQLEQRVIVASELRLEINRRFNEAGIVVAFPQRDVHLDTSEPLEVTMVDRQSLPSAQ